MKKRYPNRAQTPAVAAANGRKGKKRSPWRLGPCLNTPNARAAHERFKDGDK